MEIIGGSWRVTLQWLTMAFWPKILGDGGDLRMVLRHSMKAG